MARENYASTASKKTNAKTAGASVFARTVSKKANAKTARAPAFASTSSKDASVARGRKIQAILDRLVIAFISFLFFNNLPVFSCEDAIRWAELEMKLGQNLLSLNSQLGAKKPRDKE
jgi:hypothetical protein